MLHLYIIGNGQSSLARQVCGSFRCPERSEGINWPRAVAANDSASRALAGGNRQADITAHCSVHRGFNRAEYAFEQSRSVRSAPSRTANILSRLCKSPSKGHPGPVRLEGWNYALCAASTCGSPCTPVGSMAAPCALFAAIEVGERGRSPVSTERRSGSSPKVKGRPPSSLPSPEAARRNRPPNAARDRNAQATARHIPQRKPYSPWNQ